MIDLIAIDGPSYVGKSSISQALAALLGKTFINTGHMYRSIAKCCLEQGISYKNASTVIEMAQKTQIKFKNAPAGICQTIVNGQDWSNSLDNEQIVLFASKIASIPEVRHILTEMQRSYAKKELIIMEGRDIGSVVFPDAMWKFYVTASSEIRASRMFKMMTDEDRQNVSGPAALIERINEIDEADMNRKIAPLKKANDAIIYDNSDSPDAARDALILYYYITHTEELISNAGLLQKRRTF